MLLPRMTAARIHGPDCGAQGESADADRIKASSQGGSMQGYGCGWPEEGFGNVGRWQVKQQKSADEAVCAEAVSELEEARDVRQGACATNYGRVMTSLGAAGSRNVTPRS